MSGFKSKHYPYFKSLEGVQSTSAVQGGASHLDIRDTVEITASGNLLVDRLLKELIYARSDEDKTLITFSFPGAESHFVDGYGHDEHLSVSPVSENIRDQFVSFFDQLSALTNLRFEEVSDDESSAGTIRLAWSDLKDTRAYGWAYGPGNYQEAGDIWLMREYLSEQSVNFTKTLLHELGHALGLSHANNVGEYNSWDYTVMSTTMTLRHEGVTGSDLAPQSFMALDILALQHLYGTNYNDTGGDDTYHFDQSNRYYLTIWDAGGVDTIVVSGGSKPTNIDLRGGWLNVGTEITLYGEANQKQSYTVYLMDDVVLENVTGAAGDDTLRGNATGNVIHGNAGSDVIAGREGADTIDGGQGDDEIWGGASGDKLSGGAGDDVIGGGDGADTIDGGQGDDEIWGGASGDKLSGGAGNDIMGGGDGADTIDGGQGHNQIWGGASEDKLSGGAGDDIIGGGDGADTIDGGHGHDEIWGGASGDKLSGGAGNDVIGGGDGNDFLIGDNPEDSPSNSGSDTLYGGSGHDTLVAGNGADLIFGGSGSDLIYGGNGDDGLFGGSGKDTLSGGDGDDTLTGGADADSFVFKQNNGFDTVTDFESQTDILDFSTLNLTPSQQTQVLMSIIAHQGGSLISLPGGNSVWLQDVSPSEQNDFMFIF